MYTKWIDALEFNSYGGFIKETQFVQEMGQAYLIANQTPGIPVEDAKTIFSVPKKGHYRIWVRTKNWYKEAAPGRLKVIIDGSLASPELGKLPSRQWTFEIAGDYLLEEGEHDLWIRDVTGYFGRFSAVIITDDMDYVPEYKVERLWKERAIIRGESLEPISRGAYDVVIAGAGPAGVPAAIAAARKGLKVALIHSRPGIGGNASDEGSIGFDGAYVNHRNMRETGIAEEIRRIHDHEEVSWEQALTLLLEAECNIHLFKNEFLIDATVEEDCIKGIKTIHTEKGSFQYYEGKVFIDCTGDGWLGYYAGARYRIGREAKWQYNEPLAPEQPDSITMSGCLMGMVQGVQTLGFRTVDMGEPVAFSAPSWAVQLPEEIYRVPPYVDRAPWWLENPANYDDIWEQEEVRDELIRLNLGYFDWLKNKSEYRDLARNRKMLGMGRYNARRENRRLIGDYVLTENDCREGKTFEDAISYCGWNIDVHHPKGIYSGAEGPFYVPGYTIPITEIPFRCLYSKNIKNLMMAGRCVSASHVALGSVRVQNTLATLGQVCGTAAWMCLEKNEYPREIGTHYIEELQRTLTNDDLFIPSFRKQDALDLALQAEITASSYSKQEIYKNELGIEGEWKPLDHNIALLDATSRIGQLTELQVRIKNTKNVPLKVKCQMFYMVDYDKMETRKTIEETLLEVPAEYEGYIDTGLCYPEDKQHVGISLEQTEGIFLKQIKYARDGRRSADGINSLRWVIDENHTYDSQCIQLKPPIYANCSPYSVVNGYGRIRDNNNYCWVSDPSSPLPQVIELSWAHSQKIQRIQLVFDTDLSNPSMSFLSIKNVSKTVQDYIVEASIDGEWKEIIHVQNNYKRFNRHDLENLQTSKIRIKVLKTWGDPSARILQIKVF